MTLQRGGPIVIAHTSDLHIDERGRLADIILVLDAFLADAQEMGADLIVVAGDHFERRSTPVERVALADFLLRASKVAPVFCVRGNHDTPRDLEVFDRLASKAPVFIFDRPTTSPDSAPIITIGRRKVGLLALPWFDKAHLVAHLDASVDAEASRLLTINAAQGMLACLRMEADRIKAAGAVPILAGHVMVAGSEVSTGQTIIGTTVELSPADILEVGASYAALGHVHMTQTWHEGRVAYSGSPHRCNYGEKEPKGYRLVILKEDGTFESNEFRELPARRMVFIERDLLPSVAEVGLWSEDDPLSLWIEASKGEIREGDLLRIRYRVRSEDLPLIDAAAVTRKAEALGVAEVKLEAIVQTDVRVRASEIGQTQTLAEKVDLYLASKGIEVDAETRERLHSKLDHIEKEYLNAAL